MAETPDNALKVARALAQLGLLDVVFVGGAAVPILLSDPAALPARVTADVDVVVDVANLARLWGIETRLREAGHAPDPTGPICRWTVGGVPFDLMPTDARILASRIAGIRSWSTRPVATASNLVSKSSWPTRECCWPPSSKLTPNERERPDDEP